MIDPAELDAELAAARERNAAVWAAMVADIRADAERVLADVRHPADRESYDTGSGVLILSEVQLATAETNRERGFLGVMAGLADGTLDPISFTLTSDGSPAFRGWHTGASDPDTWVRYERWTSAGREAHGWLDKRTRRIVQTG